jgi:PilZ domain
MAGTGKERRGFPRFPLVLAAEISQLPINNTKLLARTSDVSSSGCYIDTMNPLSMDSLVRLRLIHHEEIFEVKCQVVYVSPRLGMGLRFEEMGNEQRLRLKGWLLERKEH